MIGRAALWAAGGVVVVLAAAWRGGVRLNLTASLPAGLYLVTPGSPTRGAIVMACLPLPVAAFARARGYVPRGSCPGDQVAGIHPGTIRVRPAPRALPRPARRVPAQSDGAAAAGPRALG